MTVSRGAAAQAAHSRLLLDHKLGDLTPAAIEALAATAPIHDGDPCRVCALADRRHGHNWLPAGARRWLRTLTWRRT